MTSCVTAEGETLGKKCCNNIVQHCHLVDIPSFILVFGFLSAAHMNVLTSCLKLFEFQSFSARVRSSWSWTFMTLQRKKKFKIQQTDPTVLNSVAWIWNMFTLRTTLQTCQSKGARTTVCVIKIYQWSSGLSWSKWVNWDRLEGRVVDGVMPMGLVGTSKNKIPSPDTF